MLTALFSRRVLRCDRSVAFASETFEYDNLPSGRVTVGHMTSHTIDRRATDTGALLKRVRQFDAAYDDAGNLTHVSTRRDGAQRKVSFEYDQFGLAPTHAKIDASGVPSTESFVDYDPVSLRPLVFTDANQTRRGSEFDGFDRLRRTTVTPPGGTLAVTSTVEYLGFIDPDPAGRRVVVKNFPYTAEPALVATTPGRTATGRGDSIQRGRSSP